MNVRVRPGNRIAAVLAATAWPRLCAGTEEPLSQPEGEPLLADPQRSLEQERARECVAPDRIIVTAAERLVTVEWEERHGGKVRRADPFRRVVAGAIDRHGS